MAAGTRFPSTRIVASLTQMMMAVILAVICVVLSLTAPGFFSMKGLLTVLQSVSEQGLIAFGMTMVIVAGEIDLSVGSMVAFAGCAAAWLVQAGVPVPIAIAAALALGFAGGTLTGLLRSCCQVPSFITTLALLTALRGGALLFNGGFPLSTFPGWFGFLGAGYVLGIPFEAIVFLAVFAAIQFVMSYTSFGRAVYAVGGNAEAARLSGINVTMIRVLVLAITGMLAAGSGVLVASRIMSGTPTVAQGWELEVIAAVIIGGTSLSGGAGTVWGTLIGVVFIGVIATGMTMLDVPIHNQYIVRGGIILAAVLINQLQRIRW